jgi:hypothetical protein
VIDVVDEIEQIATKEIAELRSLACDPDSRLTDEVIDRLQRLLELVTGARKEQREQKKFVRGLPDEEVL